MKWFASMVFFADETSNPKAQQAYHFVTEIGWIPTESPSAIEFPATEMQLVTWNIDAKRDSLKQRFFHIMSHMRKKVLEGIPPPPSCILLQEVHEDLLPVLMEYQWIREHYLITPVTANGWTAHHGLVTLVSKMVPVSTVFSIDLPKTTAGRQALFVDVHLSGPPPDNAEKKTTRVRTLRIANTHLESEPNGTRARAKQLESIARLLNVPNIDGHICAGSMCSVQELDHTAPSKAGFADAYKGFKKDGLTWGLQPRSQMLPCRLDKILFFPTERVEIQSPKRIGVRITVKDGEYVSDHCGLLARVKVLRDR